MVNACQSLGRQSEYIGRHQEGTVSHTACWSALAELGKRHAVSTVESACFLPRLTFLG